MALIGVIMVDCMLLMSCSTLDPYAQMQILSESEEETKSAGGS